MLVGDECLQCMIAVPRNRKTKGMSITVHGLTSAELSRKSGVRYIEAVEEWLLNRNTEFLDIEIELHINHYKKQRPKSRTRRILLLIEPAVTWPRNRLYKPDQYDRIFAAGPMKGSEYLEWFHEPLKVKPSVSENAFRNRSGNFTMIASNKLSFIKDELYSLRRQIILNYPNAVDLFGYDWNNPKSSRLRTIVGELLLTARASQPVALRGARQILRNPPNYRGMAADKLSAYSLNKYAIVIENSLELRTEKLYDAVEAGAIPIYVGPKVPGDVPQNLYLHVDAHIDAIEGGMRLVREFDTRDWLSLREEWMNSPGYQADSKARFFRLLDNLCQEILKN
jgi:hypothetical protein